MRTRTEILKDMKPLNKIEEKYRERIFLLSHESDKYRLPGRRKTQYSKRFKEKASNACTYIRGIIDISIKDFAAILNVGSDRLTAWMDGSGLRRNVEEIVHHDISYYSEPEGVQVEMDFRRNSFKLPTPVNTDMIKDLELKLSAAKELMNIDARRTELQQILKG